MADAMSRARVTWSAVICGNPACNHRDRQHMAKGRGQCTEACECTAFVRLTRQKYHNVPVAGFDSGAERGRYQELLILQQAGIITELQPPHVTLDVEPPGCERITWRADYIYREDGVMVVEEFKCDATISQAFRIQHKLARWRYPHYRFRVVMKQRGRNVVVQEWAPRIVRAA
jgi:hypothetical protein